MELSMVERRIKHRRRRVVVEKIHKTNSVNYCAYMISRDSGGKSLLLLSAEVFSNMSSSTYSVNFRLTQTTKLKLLHTGSAPYPYHIKRTMRKLRYQLKVSKLSLISGLISLNDVKHIQQLA